MIAVNTMSALPPPEALLLVLDPARPYGAETRLKALTEAAGYDVTLRASAAPVPTDMEPYALVVVSSLVGDDTVGAKYKTSTTPVAHFGVDLAVPVTNGLMAYAPSGGVSTDIVIVDDASPFVNGLAAGAPTIFESPVIQAGNIASAFGSGAVLVARRGGSSTEFLLVTYAAGATMADGTRAAARRTYFGLSSASLHAASERVGEPLIRSVLVATGGIEQYASRGGRTLSYR